MAFLGMPHEAVEDKLMVFDLRFFRKETETSHRETLAEIFKRFMKIHHSKHEFELLAIDSLPVFIMLCNMKDPRAELFEFFEWLRELRVTTFLVFEMSQGSPAFCKHDEDFLVDGIIHLLMEKVGISSVKRGIRCVKMRATNHSTDYFVLFFEDGEFKVSRAIDLEL
jgi:KaiC/GvpD/RAD55 family RecA-like ATPase